MVFPSQSLELGEGLLCLGGLGQNLDNVEADALGERAALAKENLITRCHTEGRGAVCHGGLVALLITGILGHVVEVVTADDDGTGHLGGLHNTAEHTATDGNVAGEGALLVNIVANDRLLGSLDAKADVLPIAGCGTLLGCTQQLLGCKENGLLLLECLLVLDVRHLRLSTIKNHKRNGQSKNEMETGMKQQ